MSRDHASDDRGPESDLALHAAAEALASLSTSDNDDRFTCRVATCPNEVSEPGIYCAACRHERHGDDFEEGGE